MNKTKRDAIFALCLGVPGMIICGFMVVLITFTGIIENPLVWWGGIWLGGTFSGLMWIIPILRSAKKPSEGFDERDVIIYKRATLVGYSVLWVYFVSAGVSVGWHFGPKGSIATYILLAIIFAGLTLFMLVQALAILVQYGWGDRSGQ